MKLFDSRWIGTHGIGRFAAEVSARLPEFTSAALGGKPSGALDPLKLHLFLRGARPKFFFSPGYNAPLGTPCPFSFCVHDLAHLYVAEYKSPAKRLYYELLVRPAIFRAKAVFTVSEFSRRTICNWAQVDSDRVINVGSGVSSVFDASGTSEHPMKPYFLHVGNFRAHKNFDRILQAYAASQLAGSVDLIATGTPPPHVLHKVKQHNLEAHVQFSGALSDTKLAELYRGCLAVIFASSYEGFGLPIVEAMSCGAPVITSNVTSMPEVAGDAAILVDPSDSSSICHGMQRIAADSALRQQLRIAGLKQATRHTWDNTASKIRTCLQALD